MRSLIPKTPFATRLSGSAKETQLRLRSIFQWQKKRPPVWLFTLIVLVVFSCIGLVSCQQDGEEAAQPEGFFAGYRDDFEAEVYTGVRTFTNEDRTLIYEDGPKNVVESLVAYLYYCENMVAYDDLLKHVGEGSFRLATQNAAEQADELYFDTVILHGLDTLSKDDFEPGGAYFADETTAQRFVDELTAFVEENALTEYTVVYVDLSWLWSESALDMGPQLGNGRYERLYLVGKTAQDDGWKLYECFWGEYTLERMYSWEQFALQLLESSLRYEDEVLSFTIPTPMQAGTGVQGTWDIQIAGRAENGELGGMSLHYLDGETWQPGQSYSVEIPASQWAQITELSMEVSVEGESRTINVLTEVILNGSIFDLRGEVIGLTFYDSLLDSGGSIVGGAYVADVARWLSSFTVGEALGETLPAGYSTAHVVIRYADGTQEDRPLSAVQIKNTWFAIDNPNPPEGFLQYQNIHPTDAPTDRELTFLLAKRGIEEFQHLNIRAITTLLKSSGTRTLLMAEVESVNHVAGMDNMVMGLWDENAGEFVGEIYTIHGDAADYTSWYGQDGCLYILWTNQTIYQGVETSQGLQFFAFNGETIKPLYELPECALRCGFLPGDAAQQDILRTNRDFWSDRKVRTIDQGVYLYYRNPEWDSTQPGEGEQWFYIGYVPFEVTDSGMTQREMDLLVDYFQSEQRYNRTYFLGEEPGEPQEDDLRIDSVRHLGSTPTYETTGEVYAITVSWYIGGKWSTSEFYIVMGRSMDGELYEVRGDRLTLREDIARTILEVSYGVTDWEVTLWHDDTPYPQPLALGWWNENALSFVDGEPSVEVLEGWEPSYWDGDYWNRCTLDGLSILRYYNSTQDRHGNYTIELTRDDFATLRGIRLGSTREEVKAAYPELKSGSYWAEYPGEDYLWYCDDEGDFGPAILFFFENDKVSKIILNNMFN